MNQRGASRLMVSCADCSRAVMCMNASCNCWREALRSDGSAALSASSVGVYSFEIAWRLMSATRAFTNACCTALTFDPDFQGAVWSSPGMAGTSKDGGVVRRRAPITPETGAHQVANPRKRLQALQSPAHRSAFAVLSIRRSQPRPPTRRAVGREVAQFVRLRVVRPESPLGEHSPWRRDRELRAEAHVAPHLPRNGTHLEPAVLLHRGDETGRHAPLVAEVAGHHEPTIILHAHRHVAHGAPGG